MSAKKDMWISNVAILQKMFKKNFVASFGDNDIITLKKKEGLITYNIQINTKSVKTDVTIEDIMKLFSLCKKN